MRLFTTLAIAALLGGCATVTRGTTEQVQFASDPSDAEVRTSTGFTCRTPCQVTVDRKTEFVATFTKAGYEPLDVPVTTKVSGGGAAGFTGNVLLGGVIGMTADAVSGAALDHTPNPVQVTLAPVRSAARAAPAKSRRGRRVQPNEPAEAPQG